MSLHYSQRVSHEMHDLCEFRLRCKGHAATPNHSLVGSRKSNAPTHVLVLRQLR